MLYKGYKKTAGGVPAGSRLPRHPTGVQVIGLSLNPWLTAGKGYNIVDKMGVVIKEQQW
jgi:hypothetical protein